MTTEKQTILHLMTSLENAIGWMETFQKLHNYDPDSSLPSDIGSSKRTMEEARKELAG